MAARCRQNYHAECEAEVNKQINLELYASYVYLSMAYYFDRDDVALKGFHKYFKKASDEEIEHARLFMEFQNKRGGRIILKDVKRPEKDEWGNGKDALETALDLEKSVNESLFKLHEIAQNHKDDQMSDFIESNFLHEQVDAIKELSDYITNLERVGEGLGEYQFDKLTLQEDDS